MAAPLIVRLRNWVGDVTLGLPTLQRLERAGYSLRLIGKGWARDLLAGHGWPIEPLGRTLGDRVTQLRNLRRQALAEDPGFDSRLNAIAFPYSLSSALDMRLAGLKAIGHRHEGRGWLLHRAVRRSAQAHEMAAYWELGSTVLGSAEPLPDHVRLALAPAQQQQAAAVRDQLGLRPGYVLICPFAGGTFEKLDKSWPQFAPFARQALPSLGRDLLICPGPGNEETVAERDYSGCRIARGVSLGAYAALLREAALVISNDTGPGHMAAAVGAPLLSVLGPTDPARWGAVGPSVHIVREPAGWPSIERVLDRTRTLLDAR